MSGLPLYSPNVSPRMHAPREQITDKKMTPAEIANLVIDLTDKVFGPKGWLVTVKGWEHRPPQAKMAHEIAKAITHDQPMIQEAPTGVGKSLAYLIPSVIYAKLSNRKALVSSHTINLQEQLERDVLFMKGFFNEVPELKSFSDFRSATVMGRGNYVCGTRVKELIKDGMEDVSAEVGQELWNIVKWHSNEAVDGIRTEIKFDVSQLAWSYVSADSSGCTSAGCNPGNCSYRKAKARAAKADLIILNHSLVFSTIANSSSEIKRGILMPDDFLILDEAHTVPDVATQHFGANLFIPSLVSTLKRIHNPDAPERGFSARFRVLNKYTANIERALVLIDQFCEDLYAAFPEGSSEWTYSALDGLDEQLPRVLAELTADLKKVTDLKLPKKVQVRITDMSQRIEKSAEVFSQFLKGVDPNAGVLWVERNHNGDFRLRGAFLDISSILNTHVFSCNTSAILCSATLAVGKDLKPFATRIGGLNAKTFQVPSPFNFEENMQFYVTKDCPEPRGESKEKAVEYISEFLKHTIPQTNGGTLVLFTSYTLMREVGAIVDAFCLDNNITFGMQGDGESRADLVDMLQRHGNAVLFGTSSFWTGVDVPGDALKHTVITSLPFDVPTHPVAKARSAALARSGKNPFMEIALNECVWRFRQGVGRLIRKASDKGILTVMDGRLLSKRYGRTFLDSVPQPNYTPLSREEWGNFSDPFPFS